MKGFDALDAEIHPNALKHLTAEQVGCAWRSVTKSIKRQSDDEPPRWLCIGWLPTGVAVELVVVEQMDGWLIIHANAPVQKKFAAEMERAERRAR